MASQGIRVGIIGAGWGLRHAEGYKAAGGFTITAVADLIPARRRKLIDLSGGAREYADALDLLKDVQVDAVSVCLPNAMHLPVALAALKAGKHVICDTPPALNASEAKKLTAAANKAGKVLLYGFQRRFGGAEQAARLAIEKGYVGTPGHVRASWMRTRGIPTGTGWYADRAKSGGGAMIDMGVQMLDLAWSLLGQPRPISAFAVFNQRFRGALPPEVPYDVEDAALALLKFEGNKSVELAVSWAINQPPRDNGTKCQVYAEKGAVVVYNPHGPLVYRGFSPAGEAKETPLKTPKVVHYHAMMRHFKECIHGSARPVVGGNESLVLMQMMDAISKSAESGKSVEIRAASTMEAPAAVPHQNEEESDAAAGE
ncbi:MAG TPA: Gfo/Idh/MocA family oxidoreductase [Tepidisphaeraceae bacterium]|jgi:predicted dehydrogenase|nr:Gfo/Idh/MocA family oxidoreductase [Tepidisphaeraceae bacterium]